MGDFITRRAYRGYKSAGLAVEDFVLKRCAIWNVTKVEVRIFLNWKHIVGKPIADVSRPEKVVFTDATGVLYLHVKSGGHAVFLQYAVPGIIEKISTYFGFKVIHSVKVRQ